MKFAPCVLIPCYNHGASMASLLARLAVLQLICIIVDDGSTAATQRTLQKLVAGQSQLKLLRLEQNCGKGAAVLRGLEFAAQLGFSHALQIDADGQHCAEDAPKLLALALQHPNALISGWPIFDASMPRARRYGRWITHIWVWIETLSLQLKDSMCGFRVYPIAATLRLAEQTKLGQRMDFDTEIMVRLYWQGHPSYFVPTRVTYPTNGVSNFNALTDNLRISLLHARLCCGMLARLPRMVMMRHQPAQHWAHQPELRGLWGMRIMLGVWRWFGRRAFTLLLHPIVGIYWLLGGAARRASQDWLRRVRQQIIQQHLPMPDQLSSYRHFLRFGEAMLDKVASWQGELQLGRDVVFAAGAQTVLGIDQPQGKLLLASHLGDIESCRALAQLHGIKTINALVFSDNAQHFKQIMEEVAPLAGLKLLPVTDISAHTIVLLKQKIDAGEWLAIVGDRIATKPQRGGSWRVVWSQFLGQAAPFAQGPFILAALLHCPVLLMFVLKQQGRLQIHCEPFANPLLLARPQRQAALQAAVDRYAARLEHYALQAPLDWFNFFDFWHLPESPPNRK